MVKITAGMGALSPLLEFESFLRGTYHLACQVMLERVDRRVHFKPLRRQPKIFTLSQNKIHLDFDPLVTREGLDVFYGDKVIDQYRGAIDLGIITVLLNLYYLLEWVR